MDTTQTADCQLDVLVVGAGFAGLYLLHRLRQAGFRTQVFEAGDGVGGTWYWNRYPGARCDVESIDYSYSFSPELEQAWQWSERYPRQAEILAYLNHVADHFDLRRDIRLGTRVTAAHFDESRARWRVTCDDGRQCQARFLVMATGCLSKPKVPDIPGVETFAGATYLTAAWPHEPVDFSGKQVGVVGTGSTAIQVIPQVARQAARLTVFQRTPNFSIPARNAPLPAQALDRVKADYRARRQAARESLFGVPVPPPPMQRTADLSDAALEDYLEGLWQRGGALTFMGAFPDLLTDPAANARVAQFVRNKIRATVTDPATAERLCPDDHPLGTKRLCLDSDYYQTYNRDNVTLVDLRATPIKTITGDGVITSDAHYRCDALIFATGFDAMTGALQAIDLRGRGGLTLRDAWREGPRTYLGLATAGFPNLFLVTGPQSPSVFSNMVVAIEQHVEWISDCIAALRERDLATIEADEEAQQAWVEHTADIANRTLLPRTDSWYVGANVPGKPRVFTPYLGGLGPYGEHCADVARNGYLGFVLQPRTEASTAA